MKRYSGETIKGWAVLMGGNVAKRSMDERGETELYEIAPSRYDFPRWYKAIPVTIRISPRKEKSAPKKGEN